MLTKVKTTTIITTIIKITTSYLMDTSQDQTQSNGSMTQNYSYRKGGHLIQTQKNWLYIIFDN
jgi:hypothetical protein